jgi:ATP-dependent exoDNAse (exonuclease V) beta subunit
MDGVTKRFMEKFIGRTDLPKWFPVRGTFLGPTKTLKATDPKSGVTLKGRLDALVRTANGKYHIVDYKTAYPGKRSRITTSCSSTATHFRWRGTATNLWPPGCSCTSCRSTGISRMGGSRSR